MRALKEMAHTQRRCRKECCVSSMSIQFRTLSSPSHLMMADHSTTHLLLVSLALTKRSSLHGKEYLAAENTVVEV